MAPLTEKPFAEPLPLSSGAAILQDGHYLAPPQDHDGKIWVRTSVNVQRTPEELYAMWRAVENAPLWQEYLDEVVVTGETTSRWIMSKGSDSITWESQILADEPGKRIAWKTVGGDLEEAGEVIFEAATGDRGTVVIVLEAFKLSKLANAWESIAGRGPKQAVIENLRHFKALAETGEIPNTSTAPHGDRGLIGGIKRSLYGETVPTPAGSTAR